MKDLVKKFEEAGAGGRKVLLLGHPHADPDAIGAAVGLGKILESLGAEVVVGTPLNLSKLAKSVLEYLGMKDIIVDPPLDADLVIVLDSSGLSQLDNYEDKLKGSDSEIIFIDHHRPDGGTVEKVEEFYSEEEASSTVELVLRLAEEFDFEFDSETALLMLTGIISDTGHFKFANERTFGAVVRLLEFGADYQEALEALKTPEDKSKRVAMLKAAQRSEIEKAHGRWIVFSEVGAYESDAASMFIKIGADVSIVASSGDGGVRLSSRSRSGVAAETHLHLGKLMSDLGDEFSGSGGGHAGAAGASAEAGLDEVKEFALKRARDMVRPKEE